MTSLPSPDKKNSFQPVPSRLLLLTVSALWLAVLAAVSLAMLDGTLNWPWLGLAAIALLSMLSWLRDWLPAREGRQLCTDGSLWWWADQPERAGHLVSSRVWPWWVYLQWQGPGGKAEASLVLDSLPAEDFRRLRMLAAQSAIS